MDGTGCDKCTRAARYWASKLENSLGLRKHHAAGLPGWVSFHALSTPHVRVFSSRWQIRQLRKTEAVWFAQSHDFEKWRNPVWTQLLCLQIPCCFCSIKCCWISPDCWVVCRPRVSVFLVCVLWVQSVGSGGLWMDWAVFSKNVILWFLPQLCLRTWECSLKLLKITYM